MLFLSKVFIIIFTSLLFTNITYAQDLEKSIFTLNENDKNNNEYSTKVTTRDSSNTEPLIHVEIDDSFSIYNYPAPYVVHSIINGENVLLLGTMHSNTPESPTYKTIKHLIDTNNIDMVILEGTPSSVDINDAYTRPDMEACITDPNQCITEQYYAYSVAKSKNSNIQFSGGEASPPDTYEHVVVQQGYTLEDYVGFWYVRNAVSLNQTNQMSESALRESDNRTRGYLQNSLGLTIIFDYEDWIQWYKNKMGVNTVNLSSFGQGTLEPTTRPGSTIVQNISYEFNVVRDSHLVSTINEKLTSFHNILVVYGNGHTNTIYRQLTDRSSPSPYLDIWFGTNITPDVTFTKPAGWDKPVMIKATADCNINSCEYDTQPFVFDEGEPIYLSFSYETIGGAGNVNIAPVLDGVRRGNFSNTPSAGIIPSILVPPLQNLSPGNHTIGVKLDYDNSINERNESNNEYSIGIIINDSGNDTNTYSLPHNTWRLISLPSHSNASPTLYDLFGDNLPSGEYGSSWIIYSFDSVNQEYVSPGLNDELEQGVGYWIIQLTKSTVILDINTGAPTTSAIPQCPTNSSGCFEIPLTTTDRFSWNLLGYPFNKSLAWNQQIIITDSGPCADENGCTLDQARNEGIFYNQGFSYTDAHYGLLQNNTPLASWMGFWAAALPGASGLNPRLLIPKF